MMKLKLKALLLGFSLLECLIVLILISVGLLLVTPSFQRLIQKSYADNLTFQLISAINFTRISAISSDHKVAFCGSSDHHHCDGNWRKGQIVIGPQSQQVIRFYPSLRSGYQLVWKSSLGKNKGIIFTPNGLTEGQQGSFYLRYLRHGVVQYLSRIVLSRVGQTRIEDCGNESLT